MPFDSCRISNLLSVPQLPKTELQRASFFIYIYLLFSLKAVIFKSKSIINKLIKSTIVYFKSYMPFYFDDVYPRFFFFFSLGRSPSTSIRAEILTG